MRDARQPDDVAIDEEAISEPVAGPKEDEPIEQQNVGGENMEGTGEWPDPDERPTGPAPGTDPLRQDEIEAQRAVTTEAEGTAAAAPEATQSGREGTSTGEARTADTDRGLAREINPPSGFKEVLDANPVMGGSNSIKDEDEVYVDERRPRPPETDADTEG